MSLADFDDILFICCDWDSEKFSCEMIKVEKIKFTRGQDVVTVKANWWEKAEIFNDQTIGETDKEKEEREGVLV